MAATANLYAQHLKKMQGSGQSTTPKATAAASSTQKATQTAPQVSTVSSGSVTQKATQTAPQVSTVSSGSATQKATQTAPQVSTVSSGSATQKAPKVTPSPLTPVTGKNTGDDAFSKQATYPHKDIGTTIQTLKDKGLISGGTTKGTASGSGVSAASGATQETTYIGADGNPKKGYVVTGAAGQENSGGIYSDFLQNAGSGATTYYDRLGNKQTGYIINGKMYTDPQGKREIPDGSYIVAADGRVYNKTAAGSDLVWSPNSGDYASYDADEAAAASGEFIVPGYGTMSVAYEPRSGRYTVYDSKHNSVGYLDNAGNFHTESTGAVYQPYNNTVSRAAKEFLGGKGVAFNGSGVNTIDATQQGVYGTGDAYLSDVFTHNQMMDEYSEDLANGGDGADVLARYGYVYDGNNVVHYVGGGTGGASSGTTAKPAATPAAAPATSQTVKPTATQTVKPATVPTPTTTPTPTSTTPTTTPTPAPAPTPAPTPTPEPNIQPEPEPPTVAEAEPELPDAPEYSAQMLQLKDQLSTVDDLLAKAIKSGDERYAAQLRQLRERIQQQISAMADQYQNINKQLYIDYMNARRDLPQQLAAQGYTGGLRESSILGLAAGYEGQLAENERQRIIGERDLASKEADQALTYEIEHGRAQQEAEDQAFERAERIREQMLEQMNRVEDLARADAKSARTEARAQIDAFLGAGGDPSQIPAQLLEISGYSAAYVSQMASEYLRSRASEQADAIIRAGGNVPQAIAEAAGYSTEYTDALAGASGKKEAQSMVAAILDAGGTVPLSIAEAAGYSPEFVAAMTGAKSREEARAMADSIIRAGGTVPRSIAEAAGYGTEYTSAMSGALSRQDAQSMVAAILDAGGTVPLSIAEAAGYSPEFVAAMTGASNQRNARAQADSILSAGGTVPGSLAQSAGYSTEYADTMNAMNEKPTLTAAQVLSSLKQGIRTKAVLDAYEYYYGEPYEEPEGDAESVSKPALTAAQVLNALKQGIRTKAVLDAYEYYYGEPYESAEAPTNTPPYTPPDTPVQEDEGSTTSAAALVAKYRPMLEYVDGYASERGITPAQARDELETWIANDMIALGIDRATIEQVAAMLGI